MYKSDVNRQTELDISTHQPWCRKWNETPCHTRLLTYTELLVASSCQILALHEQPSVSQCVWCIFLKGKNTYTLVGSLLYPSMIWRSFKIKIWSILKPSINSLWRQLQLQLSLWSSGALVYRHTILSNINTLIICILGSFKPPVYSLKNI